MRINWIQNIIDAMRGKTKNLSCKVYDYGKNNTVKFGSASGPKGCTIVIHGNNNEIVIDTDECFQAYIAIGTIDCETNNCKVNVGEKTDTSGNVCIRLLEDNTVVNIGKDVMFAANIAIFTSDTHSIVDLEGKIINIGKSVDIGNHVWVCGDCKILKNTKIPSYCVVATDSIVTKRFEKENCIIAGNPAKVVKENINWNRYRPQEYIRRNNG